MRLDEMENLRLVQYSSEKKVLLSIHDARPAVEKHEKHSRLRMIYVAYFDKKCRRLEFLKEYEQESGKANEIYETCCDVCESKVLAFVPSKLLFHGLDENGLLDVTDDARDILELYHITRFKKTIEFLLGTFFPQAPLYPLRAWKYFGKGSKKSHDYWAHLFNRFTTNLSFCGGESEPYLKGYRLSKAGEKFLRSSKKVTIDLKKEKHFQDHLKRTDKVFMLQIDSSQQTKFKCVNENEDQSEEAVCAIHENRSSSETLKRKFSDEQKSSSSLDTKKSRPDL